MQNPKIAIIGGSGLYEMKGLKILEERKIDTPFGDPSDPFVFGELEGVPVAFLARHGRGHRILPTDLNFRANIYAIKKIGCSFVLSVSAVGSLKEEIEPGHMVMVDQFIDRTSHRASTFFGGGVVGHVSFAEPICGVLRKQLYASAQAVGAVAHPTGTYVCIEGPMFSTKAESRLYRSWGADVIGMTNLQEAKLAREAELCYASMAMSTDYDCWHEGHDAVTAEMILQTLHQNNHTAHQILRHAVPEVARLAVSHCGGVLKNAIFTDRTKISAELKEKLKVICGDLLSS